MRVSVPSRQRLRQSSKKGFGFVRRHWKAILVWGFTACFVLAGLVALWAATLRIPDLSSLENRKVEQSTKIYDRTGTVVLYDLNDTTQRTIVPITEISPEIQHATIAIEDPNFYTNIGIEPKAILRAALSYIIPGDVTQGGSTLTQQVVKLTILTGDKTIARKLKEWILAVKLEHTLTKDQILELYLNQAPYGGSIYGVEQASETFFGKKAADLDLVEAAYLAAVLPAPTYYSPYGAHRDALEARKNLVLEKMFEHGYITETQEAAAKAVDLVFQPQKTTSIQAPHFVFYVQQYLENKYGDDALEAGGWKVITTLDADLQAKAESIVQAGAVSNEKNFNASNAAMIALDPTNGQILVMVGSRNYFDTEIDGAFNAAVTPPGRQPGSSFKPFVYATAFEEGYTPDTVLFDVHTQFSTTCSADNLTTGNGCYSPVNYDGLFRGPMTLRDALAQSINVPAVKLLYLAGINNSLQTAKSMGISTLLDANHYGLTLVLGGGEVTLLDMTSAYGVFANNGVRVVPTPILKITDASGKVIEDNTNPVGTQVLQPNIAQEISDILSDAVARAPLGENDLLQFPGHDVAVKTGTTNDYRDAWTIGYTPNIAVGIWAGNNDNSPMVKKVSGFIVGPMWHQFMAYALAQRPTASFTRTEVNETGLKPVLRGIWQGNDTTIQNGIEYVTQSVHDILYWVDKSNPNGPVPTDPTQDPQFRLWEPAVRAWAQQNGYTDGALIPVGAAPTVSGTTTPPIVPVTTTP